MAEYLKNKGCPQKDSAEHEGYAGARRSFRRIWKERNSAQPELLEKILDRNNLNRAFKRVKANKGAPGIDGRTVGETLTYLKKENHNHELVETIQRGKYRPTPVRRVEIPKPDGGVRKLGIPTVTDRIIQQAMAQQLIPLYEPLFAKGSYGYRPGRSAKDAIGKVKEYAEQGAVARQKTCAAFFVAKKKYPQTLKSLGVRVKLKYAKTTIYTLRLYNVRKHISTSSSFKCGISHS